MHFLISWFATLPQIFYGRFRSDKKGSVNKGCREVDLFVKQVDGKKVIDSEKQEALRSRLRSEMLHSLRVMIVSRGPDTELLVANPVELSGKGRPRVFYDATLALKALGICIFSVRILDRISLKGRKLVHCELVITLVHFRLRLGDRQHRSVNGRSTDSSWTTAENSLWPPAQLIGTVLSIG